MKSLHHFIGLTLFLLLLTGCAKEDKYHFDMELDGNLSYIYPYDLNESERETPEGKALLRDLSLERKYLQTSNIVENNIYNFLFAQQIRTKTNLAPIFSHKLIRNSSFFPSFFGLRFAILDIYVAKDTDGYYRYKLYAPSNMLASFYELNDVQKQKLDIGVQFYADNSKMVNRETLEITSNEINISAKEVESILDNFGIPHERLSFQPEDF